MYPHNVRGAVELTKSALRPSPSSRSRVPNCLCPPHPPPSSVYLGCLYTRLGVMSVCVSLFLRNISKVKNQHDVQGGAVPEGLFPRLWANHHLSGPQCSCCKCLLPPQCLRAGASGRPVPVGRAVSRTPSAVRSRASPSRRTGFTWPQRSRPDFLRGICAPRRPRAAPPGLANPRTRPLTEWVRE